jgi:hypothetical protein
MLQKGHEQLRRHCGLEVFETLRLIDVCVRARFRRAERVPKNG